MEILMKILKYSPAVLAVMSALAALWCCWKGKLQWEIYWFAFAIMDFITWCRR